MGDGDEVVLCAVRLICEDSEVITSSTQRWGTWHSGEECPSGFDGATLNIQGYQGKDVRPLKELGIFWYQYATYALRSLSLSFSISCHLARKEAPCKATSL